LVKTATNWWISLHNNGARQDVKPTDWTKKIPNLENESLLLDRG
jgi:hypothetical protein